jgi:septum formation protein
MTAPLILASTSPQRRAILEQLRLPFRVVAPDYQELPGTSPLERAAGKARSVDGGESPVLGVDTEVLFRGELLGKPADATQA